MSMRITPILLLLVFPFLCHAQDIEMYKDNRTLTYDETISFYSVLDSTYDHCRLFEYGVSDIGKPMYLFVINPDQDFTPSAVHRNGKTVLLINNGIHPGEPCGVDASANLAQDLLDGTLSVPANTVVCIIPLYNIGGALNRGCCSRANQNGPEEYGFRGNARNLDLNRDFIKLDSRNAHVFTEIFRDWSPHLFVDTHTSNGADYQHIMTLINSQQDKLHPVLSEYMNALLLPHLYEDMEDRGYPMVPYVHTVDQLPENGIMDYLETPRYSTGYAALFNCIGFVTETHMLKTYEERVESTYEFLVSLVDFTENNSETITEAKEVADEAISNATSFDLQWELDTTRYDLIPFMGYEAKYKDSEVGNGERLWYDRESPWEAEIPYYNRYNASITVEAPRYYIVPQAWREVIDRLELNEIEMKRLDTDTVLAVDSYFILGGDTGNEPYEGHYLHRNVQVELRPQEIQYYEGDYVIEVDQTSNRYIVETLEPHAADAFFAWNFFDEIVQQKEWFSPYVFEDRAAEILAADPELQAELDSLMQDEEFANNPWAPLYFVYSHSEYYEDSHQRYPVARIEYQLDCLKD